MSDPEAVSTELAYLSLGSRAVELGYPAELGHLLSPLLGASARPPRAVELTLRLDLRKSGDDQFELTGAGKVLESGGLGPVVHAALTEAQRHLIDALPDGALLLHAASVSRGEQSVLIAGESRSGKSSLTAWLLARGFDYRSDEITALMPGERLDGLRRPLVVREDVWESVAHLPWITQVIALANNDRLVQAPTASDAAALDCGLIIFTEFTKGATAWLEPIAPARAAALLMARNHGGRQVADSGFASIFRLAARVPAVRLVYGDIAQLDALESFVAGALEHGREQMNEAIAAANGAFTAPPPPPYPAATPRKGPVRLTIGMATHSDYDGVYFTVQALRLYHPEVLKDAEIIVIDNNPMGKEAKDLKALDKMIPNYRYVPLPEQVGSALSKQRIFEEAEGKYVLVLDCHVLVNPGGIKRLLEYFERNPETNDLLQGPLLFDELDHIATHWDPEWRGGMPGKWGNDPRAADPDAEPFEIPMMGMGLFACRREAWLGFNPLFRGFGGEEGYIHDKYRHAGHRALCLPFLRWLHRFARPNAPVYVNRWEDRIFNHFAGAVELGLPADDMERHFTELLGRDVAERIFADIRRELGIDRAQPLAATG